MPRPYAVISLALSIVIGLVLVSIIDDTTNPALRGVKPSIYKLVGIGALATPLKQYIPTNYLRLPFLGAGLPTYYQHSKSYETTNVNTAKARGEAISTRQLEEETRLRDRIRRDSKRKWDSSHPRYRLLTAMHGFARYKDRNLAEAERWSTLYLNSPKRHRTLIESTVGYTSKLEKVKDLFAENNVLAQAILDNALHFYGVDRAELDQFIQEAESNGIVADKTSTSQAMKHFVRDWSTEGLFERDAAFPCVVEALKNYSVPSNNKPLRVLVPGSGLGRLAHDIAKLEGFKVTSNEWSSYMNIAYRYVEGLRNINSETFFPFIDWWSHQAATADLLRPVKFPDSPPFHANSSLDRSLIHIEGDFTSMHHGLPAAETKYDVVVTLFFIDTARNLMSYFETIRDSLNENGTWINLGPLLYGSAPFLQLSMDEIVDVCEHLGFEFLDTSSTCGVTTLDGRKVRSKEVPYGLSDRSLSKNAYKAQFWVAKKGKAAPEFQ
ncbi:methyltransferase [Nannizzia gypsea CBS 118893]|uniref:Methyltransferase n=1 Tax=Arthroderma gypseum (strain ATCC MYA-4604 / CBS 118893) TaxID=535722 RepID=E5R1D6_ARTGP|nr:methyltransferase [Nannizzia gypsea CBS 118893]EFQ97687.1 methyltransferase [Nannizzia gypsea CBS 118893]